MSLRDQLLAKGLVSKKKARKSDQDKRKQRKKDQGNQKRKHVLVAEEAASKKAARQEREARRLAERAKREAQRAAYERVLRIRQILGANQVRVGGPLPFFYLGLDGRTVHRLQVSEAQARALRNGDLAIAAHAMSGRVTVAVLVRRAAEKLQHVAPEVLVHFHPDSTGVSSPDLAVTARSWEPDLRAHRYNDDSGVNSDGKGL